MEKYDIKIHLPQQMEHLYNGYAEGNAEVIERSLSNVKDILQDKTFQDQICDFEKDIQSKVQTIDGNAVKHIKTNADVKTLSDVIVIVNNAQTQLNLANNGFIEDVKLYISKYINQDDGKK